MLFQVIRGYDNKPMLKTEYESCIPYDDLESLHRAGYKFKLDGKSVSYAYMMNRRNIVDFSVDEDLKKSKKKAKEAEESQITEVYVNADEKAIAELSEKFATNDAVESIVPDTEVIPTVVVVDNSNSTLDVELVPKSKRNKKVKCIETDTIYDSQSIAAKAVNINPAYVSMSIKSGKACGGYTFVRVEE